MQNHPSLVSTLLLLSIIWLPRAQAGDAPPAFEGLTESHRYQNVTVTHYSATPRGGSPCKYECGKNGCVGGKDESSSGVRPLSATYEKPGMIKGRSATLAAVPQVGGNSELKGCFFTYAPSKGQKGGIPEEYTQRLFYAGDVYGSQSNKKIKTDISSTCTPKVNTTYYNVELIAFNCGGKKGGPQAPIARNKSEDAPVAKKKDQARSKPASVASNEDEEQPSSQQPAPRRKKSGQQRSKQASRSRPAPYTTANEDWAANFWRGYSGGQ